MCIVFLFIYVIICYNNEQRNDIKSIENVYVDMENNYKT